MGKKTTRFTIVGLLIVIVVITVLAAITIVAFNGIQRRAQSAAVSSALGNAVRKIKLYQVDNGVYPSTLAAADVSDGATTYQYASTSTTYCVTGTQGATSLYVSDTQTTAVSGGCPGHGQGGVAPIVNLATNPSVEANTASIAGYFSPVIARVTDRAVAGSASVQATTNSAVNTQGIIWTAASPASAAVTYSCSISLSGTAGTQVLVSGRAVTAAYAYLAEGLGVQTVTLSDSWQRVAISFTTPANTGVAYLQYRTATAVSGVNIWADAMICTQSGTTYAYADGSSASWVWNGAPHASASTGPAL